MIEIYPKMKFTLKELVVVGEVLKSVPARTPNRLDLILEYIQSVLSDVPQNADQKLIDVDWIGCGMDRFQLTKECLDSIKCFVPQLNETISRYDGKTFTPIIALPSKIRCCGKSIKILGRHATMKLYDVNQLPELLSYHGRCQTCKTSYGAV